MGMRLAELRRKAGLTQKSVADKLDVGLRYYQSVEYGGKNLTCAVIDDVLSIVGATDADFIILEKPYAKRRSGRPKGGKGT
jgi:transcriptional regulator with XRE-family HTH domain